MEFVAGDIEGGHFSVTHFDAFFIDTFIKGTFNFEPSIGRRRTDQLDNGHAIDQRFATPVLGDMAEQTVLNLIPFGCSWRIMVHVDDQVLSRRQVSSNSIFHNLTRAPFEPPQSAVMVNSRTVG